MPVSEPFTGLYSKPMRDALPLLTGQETKVFLAVATYCDDQGKCFPGLRELSAVTTYPPPIVGELLLSLQAKNVVAMLRQNERDPLTGKMIPDVYAVNPALVLCSSPLPAFMNAYTYRHSSMPVTPLGEEFAQPDRITEPETENQNQRSRITPREDAALLPNANARVATRSSPTAIGANAVTHSTAGSEISPNSTAQRHTSSPSSAAPPSADGLTFAELSVATAVRRDVPDMSAETVRGLIRRFGVEQVAAAVNSYKKRNQKNRIARPTGWIIRNLESGAKHK